MIDILIEKGDYEAALRLIGNQKDEESLYKRVVCLQALDRKKEALEVAKEAIVKSSKRYYDILSLEIALMVDLELDDEALKILEEELSMPYIPSEYEEIYTSTYEVLKKKKKAANHQASPYDQLTTDELKALLKADNKPEVIVQVINQLDSRNVRHFMFEVEDFLESEAPNYLKTLLLEVLIDQNIDVNLKVKHNDLMIEVNPKDLTRMMDQPGLNEVLNLQYRFNENKDVTLISYYNDLVIYYFADNYPLEINKDEYIYIAAACYYVAYSNLSPDYEVEELAKKYDLNSQVLNAYCVEVEKLPAI